MCSIEVSPGLDDAVRPGWPYGRLRLEGAHSRAEGRRDEHRQAEEEEEEGRLGRDAALDLDPGPGREPARHAGVRRRRALGGDGGAALRPPRLHARCRGVHRCLPRRVDGRDPPGVPLDRGRGQRDPAVLGPDGLGVAVPDRQLRHGLLPRLHRPDATGRWCSTSRRSARRRGSSARSTTCGSAGSPTSACPAPTGPREAATCSSGRATTGRCPTAASTSRTRARRGWCVLGRAFMVDGDPGPPVEAIRDGVRISPYVPARRGHGGRRRSSPARSHPRPGRPGPRAAVHRGLGRLVQHDRAERLRLLGDRRRAGAAGAGRGGRPRAAGPARRRRDRQGHALRARRAHAQGPRGRRRRGQRHGAHDRVRAAGGGGLRGTTPARGGSTGSGSAATSSSTPRRRSPPRASCRARATGRAS